MSDEMGTTTTVLTEGEPQLAGTEQVAHMPTPWNGTYFRDGHFRLECGSGGTRFLIAKTTSDTNIDKANALFIIRACNSYDDMLAALDAAVGYLLNAKIDLETGASRASAILLIEFGLTMTRNVIAKAEGRTP